MPDIKKILVVSTSTTACRKTIHYAVTLAKQVGAKLYIYHSDYAPFDVGGWGLPIPSLKSLRESYLATLAENRRILDRIIEQEKTPDMQITVFVNDKSIVKEVPRIVDEEGIDLLIMTAFEEGRLEHFIFSSGSHEIVLKMPCSILLVKESHSLEQIEEGTESLSQGREDFQRP